MQRNRGRQFRRGATRNAREMKEKILASYASYIASDIEDREHFKNMLRKDDRFALYQSLHIMNGAL